MSKYIQLNPFQPIMLSLEAFLEAQYPLLTTLMLREYEGQSTSRLREMNITKMVPVESHYAGIININIINEKFAMGNMKTTKEARFTASDTSSREVNSDWFGYKFIDEREHLKIQLSFKQFRTDNLAITDVIYSTRYELFPDDVDPFAAAVLTREDTALLWNDPPMVIAVRQFWAVVEPILNAWTPDITDITSQTVFIG